MRDWLARHGAEIRNLFAVVLFGIGLLLLHREFKSIHLKDVAASFRELPWSALLLSLFFTAANFAILIGYDLLGLRLVSIPLGLKRVATVSLLYYAFANTLGPMFGSATVRMRLYSAWGVSLPDIARIIVFIATAFWVGLFTLGGTLFVLWPFDIPDRFHLPVATSRLLGGILLSIAAVYFAACVIRRRPLHFLSVNFQPPPIGVAVSQTVVAGTDLLFTSAALYVLLPSEVHLGFLPCTSIFLLAIIVSLVSHVPGGLGVLELVLITMLPSSKHGLVASLLAFRVIYYFFPLMTATLAVAWASLRQQAGRIAGLGELAAQWSTIVSPRIITGAVFVAGLFLLISGALPAAEGRMEIVRRLLPLPIVELSHFLGSVVGVLLLVLARSLQRRIDAAWGITVGLLGVGIVVSLIKGFDYEEAIVLSVLLLAFLPCRKHFFRHGQLLAPRMSLNWIAAILLSLGLTVWILLFTYQHVEYRDDLWWQFAFHSDAPRSLRALLGVIVVLCVVGVGRILQSQPDPPVVRNENELSDVASIVLQSKATNANLALLGDKRFIFSTDRKAFVMFGCAGNSWIAMGDPVGPEKSADDAAWKFREACDAAGVWAVFYQVDEGTLGRYVEMGFYLLKLGEEARVPLKTFSLEGSSRKDLRRTLKKANEAGLRFEIVPTASVPALLPRLRVISDGWLRDKATGEKGFSLGFYDETYLLRYDIAIIRNANNEVIAFANIWRGSEKTELSIDLMRYLPDAPHGVMELLFVELILHGRQEGYEWFNLGVAPLSGIDSHRLGPMWNRVFSLVFRHGEHFYNFQGLRTYKEKFEPVWFPKYLASSGGFATPQILANVSTLIAGGLKSLVRR